jgi:hypothetical protein
MTGKEKGDHLISSRLVVNTNMDISSEDLTLAKRDDIF